MIPTPAFRHDLPPPLQPPPQPLPPPLPSRPPASPPSFIHHHLLRLPPPLQDTRHVTDSPSLLTSGGPAYLPPVAPLPLRRGLSRQVHQPKCYSATCVCVPSKAEQCVRWSGSSLSFSFFFSLSLSFSPLSPSFSFSLPFPADYLFYRLFSPLSIPLPVCLRLSLSFSPYCLSLSVYPLRHHFTQQCRVVVSCHPAYVNDPPGLKARIGRVESTLCDYRGRSIVGLQ